MLELITICAVVVFLLMRAEKARASRSLDGASQLQNAKPVDAVHRGAATELGRASKVHRMLAIEGTTAFPLAKAGIFKGFGVPVATLCDVRSFASQEALDSYPPSVSQALHALYEEGTAVGGEVMRLINHSRPLGPDETLYFTLATVGSQESDFVMHAFVDKTR